MGKKKKGQGSQAQDGGGAVDKKTAQTGGGGDTPHSQPGPSGHQKEKRPSIGPGGDADSRGQSQQQRGAQPQKQQQQQQPGDQPQQQQRGGQPERQQQQRGGQPERQQQQRGGQPQQHQRGGQPQQQQQQRGDQPQQQQQQRGDQPQRQQQQRGGQPQQQQQQRGDQPQQQQQQRGDQPQRQQQQRGGQPQQQQQQRGGQPQQHQRGGQPQQQQQQRGGPPQQPQQSSWQQGPSQQQQQRGDQPQQQQRGGQPERQQPQQSSWQQGPSQQQQQRGDQPQQQQRGGQPERQQQQRGGQPQQQQQQRGGPPQQPQQSAWQQGPSQQQQQRGGPPQQPQQSSWQQGPSQQQRGGPPQQTQQSAWQQGPSQQQQQRGDPPQHQQQSGRQQVPSQQQQRGAERKTQDWKKKDKPVQSPTSISASSSTLSLASQMSQMSVKSAHVRLDRGTKGRKIVIETNYLDLLIGKIINNAFQYDVKFEPDKPKRFLRLAFEEFRRTNVLVDGRPVFLAFDGKSIAYSPIRLPQSTISAEVKAIEPDSGQEKEFKVTLKETENSEIELTSLKTYQNSRIYDKPMRAIQCLDVVLRSPCYGRTTQAGRSFYTSPPKRIDLRDGYELWYGLFQAAVLGDTPLLNIDISHKSFPSNKFVTEIISEMRNVNPNAELDQNSRRNLTAFLKGLDIYYCPPDGGNKKRYKFNELKDSAERQTFITADNRKMTVLQYFQTKNHALRYPKMPCLHVGSITRNIYLPAELCQVVPGQVSNKKTATNQVRELIRHAAVSTVERKQKIMNAFQNCRHGDDPTIRAFGVGIGRDFLNVDARIISAPRLKYGNDAEINTRKGSWRAENVSFLQPSRLIKWAILSIDRQINDYDIRNLGTEIAKLGAKLNMNIERNYEIVKESEPRNFDQRLSNLKKMQCELVFVILSFYPESYSQIKQAAEIRNGILTQCIKSETLKRRFNASTVNNILLKVNAKLNGINHKVNDQNKTPIMNDDNVMFLGADVTHPSPEQRSIPSVVGVAASHDKTGFQYNMRWRLQDPKKEIIDDMENILKEQLEFYKLKCQRYPSKIMYYRDGVSDGQFEFVRRTELTAMDRAIQNIKPKPKITCIVVQKRHHTRFFPKPGTGVGDDDRFKNVPPGTIVDTKITHPNESQFFLVSHESIQGTAKPTKYCIIRDDSDLNIDDLQQITFNLCHMFARCNRSVSYPAPAYNAHLAAARGKVYIEQRNPLNMNNLNREYLNRQINECIVSGNPMFFV